MLLLKPQQVRFCQAVVLEEQSSHPVAGFIYRDRLFTQGEVYDKASKQDAFTQLRAILDAYEHLLVVAVDEPERWSLWYFNCQLKKRFANGKVTLAQPDNRESFVNSALNQLASIQLLFSEERARKG